jgi:hypothetical protein
VVDSPEQKDHPDSSEEGAGDQARSPSIGAVIEPPAKKTQSINEKWWKQPEHIIQVFILAFVASYTVLTFCLLRTSQDTEGRQLRAYIVVTAAKFATDESGEFRLGRTNPEGLSELMIYYDVSNEGITPAYGLQQIVAVQYPFDGKIEDKEWATPGVTAYVGKQHTFGPIRTRPFTKDQIDQIRLGKGGPFVFAGKIIYRDIFKCEWPTNFCFMWVLAPVDPTFISCPRFSDADRLNYAE